jgi:hypothetical protein
VESAYSLNAESEALSPDFLSSDFAVIRTSGEYIVLARERQWKSDFLWRQSGAADGQVRAIAKCQPEGWRYNRPRE